MKVGRGETNHLFVDVDGTLLIWKPPGKPGGPTGEQRLNVIRTAAGGECFDSLMPDLNVRLIEQIKIWHRSSGGTLVIWSMGGRAHAEAARILCNFGTERVVTIAKPDLAIDDNPMVWSKRAGPLDVAAPHVFSV